MTERKLDKINFSLYKGVHNRFFLSCTPRVFSCHNFEKKKTQKQLLMAILSLLSGRNIVCFGGFLHKIFSHTVFIFIKDSKVAKKNTNGKYHCFKTKDLKIVLQHRCLNKCICVTANHILSFSLPAAVSRKKKINGNFRSKCVRRNSLEVVRSSSSHSMCCTDASKNFFFGVNAGLSYVYTVFSTFLLIPFSEIP